MKKLSILFIWSLGLNVVLAGLSGCGVSNPTVTLRPKLPTTFRSQGWGALKKSGGFWELAVAPSSGAPQVWNFAPDQTTFPLVELPPSDKGKWTLALKFWAKSGTNGVPKVILSGQKALERGSLTVGSVVEISLAAMNR